jgi:hypothetical protein
MYLTQGEVLVLKSEDPRKIEVNMAWFGFAPLKRRLLMALGQARGVLQACSRRYVLYLGLSEARLPQSTSSRSKASSYKAMPKRSRISSHFSLSNNCLYNQCLA